MSWQRIEGHCGGHASGPVNSSVRHRHLRSLGNGTLAVIIVSSRNPLPTSNRPGPPVEGSGACRQGAPTSLRPEDTECLDAKESGYPLRRDGLERSEEHTSEL